MWKRGEKVFRLCKERETFFFEKRNGKAIIFGTKYRTAGTKRCVVCGVWTTFHGFCTGCITTHSTPEVSEEHEELISKIDAEFDPQIATIEEKIFQKEDDIEKIEGELEELCNLFGHDAEIIDSSNEIFQCHCCNKKLSYREYIDAHWKATYKNVVPYYYSGE